MATSQSLCLADTNWQAYWTIGSRMSVIRIKVIIYYFVTLMVMARWTLEENECWIYKTISSPPPLLTTKILLNFISIYTLISAPFTNLDTLIHPLLTKYCTVGKIHVQDRQDNKLVIFYSIFLYYLLTIGVHDMQQASRKAEPGDYKHAVNGVPNWQLTLPALTVNYITVHHTVNTTTWIVLNKSITLHDVAWFSTGYKKHCTCCSLTFWQLHKLQLSTIPQYWCRKNKNATGKGGDYKCFGPCSTVYMG